MNHRNMRILQTFTLQRAWISRLQAFEIGMWRCARISPAQYARGIDYRLGAKTMLLIWLDN